MTPRQQEGKMTAWEIFQAAKGSKEPYGWWAFCVVPDFCTRPCSECGRDAIKAKESH